MDDRDVVDVVTKHRAARISHVIPFFQLCTNSQKSQNFNDLTSNVETTGRELRATSLRNHPRPVPNSALRRQVVEHDDVGFSEVREHRAPKGALRQPSRQAVFCGLYLVRKHRAPKGALRRIFASTLETYLSGPSESTERQKVH